MRDSLKPFWRYYGGKFRAAPRYPQPLHDTIVEPFAGAAGYSLRYYQRKIVLVEKYPVVAEIWRYLIGVHSDEILRIPLVEHVDDLPSWVPQGGRWLVGFAMNAAVAQPCKQLSSGRKKLREMGRVFEGWSELMRSRVAVQVEQIKHWEIREVGYEDIFDFNPQATWFIDPPYRRAGIYYKHSSIDYAHLAAYCKSRSGQVMVCENEGADWLPFRTFATIKSSHMRTSGTMRGSGYSKEVIWESSPSFSIGSGQVDLFAAPVKLPDHPIWKYVLPYVHDEVFALPAQLHDLALDVVVNCTGCGQVIHPFEEQEGGGISIISTCESEICARR